MNVIKMMAVVETLDNDGDNADYNIIIVHIYYDSIDDKLIIVTSKPLKWILG